MNEPDVIRQRERAARNMFSLAFSKVRQPIESFFNWLNKKLKFKERLKSEQPKGC